MGSGHIIDNSKYEASLDNNFWYVKVVDDDFDGQVLSIEVHPIDY